MTREEMITTLEKVVHNMWNNEKDAFEQCVLSDYAEDMGVNDVQAVLDALKEQS